MILFWHDGARHCLLLGIPCPEGVACLVLELQVTCMSRVHVLFRLIPARLAADRALQVQYLQAAASLLCLGIVISTFTGSEPLTGSVDSSNCECPVASP